jgi:hypothetical protein
MKLCLHIGSEKTGSTSLQKFFSSHDDELRASGIAYCASLGRPNNRKISVYARDSNKPDDGFAANKIDSPQEHQTFREKLAASLGEEVRRAGDEGIQTFVISSEHCHSRLTSVDMVERLRHLLVPLFEEISIICFLRPQIEMCLSFASTRAKGGAGVDSSYFDIDDSASYYNFEILLDRWASVFGAANVYPKPFKRIGDVIAEFQGIVGSHIAAGDADYAANASVDVRSMAISNAIGLQRFRDRKTLNRNREFERGRVNATTRIGEALANRRETGVLNDDGDADG